ncbi:hypothetical protein Tco_0047584 [Tanacetum coccineum]
MYFLINPPTLLPCLREVGKGSWPHSNKGYGFKSALWWPASRSQWEDIENGNIAPKTTVVEGVEKVIPPTTVEEKAQKSSETLDQTFDRLQKLVSQLEILGETLSQEYVNQKLLKSLSTEWNIHVFVWRNKPELETMSMDDIYNNLKVYELEVKGTSSLNTSTQNMAFMSSNNSDSTNEAVNTSHEVSATSTQVSAANSINVDNLKEMDLRWQMAMLTIRARRFLKNIGRRITINGNQTIGFDKSDPAE